MKTVNVYCPLHQETEIHLDALDDVDCDHCRDAVQRYLDTLKGIRPTMKVVCGVCYGPYPCNRKDTEEEIPEA